MATTHPFNVVLVHGAFVDASGWQAVYQILRRDGYQVSMVQNPTMSLTGDVEATKYVLAAQDRPVILVGHSYGGAVITEAGTDPKVAGLVYVCAFAPDAGESIESLIANPVPGAPAPPLLPPRDGSLVLDRAKFHGAFAADSNAELAAFMADSQVPWGLAAVGSKITKPAWKTKPSWYLIGTEDRMVPPAAQRMMAKRAGSTVVEETGSHTIFLSKPDVVATVIRNAATSQKLKAAA